LISRTDGPGDVAELAALLRDLLDEGAEERNSTSIKHLTQSVKDGRLVTFIPVDMDEITGYVAGWDDLRQPCPRIFVVVPPTTTKGLRRVLVPFYNTVVELHDESTAPRDESEPFYETYEQIIRPFKTYVLSNYFGQGRKNHRGGATPRRKAAV
jgi:hypothetical protein